jgi:hypothetical protein
MVWLAWNDAHGPSIVTAAWDINYPVACVPIPGWLMVPCLNKNERCVSSGLNEHHSGCPWVRLLDATTNQARVKTIAANGCS